MPEYPNVDYFFITGCDDNSESYLSAVFTQGHPERIISWAFAVLFFADARWQTDDLSHQEERCWHVCLCGHEYGWREGQRPCRAGGVRWVSWYLCSNYVLKLDVFDALNFLQNVPCWCGGRWTRWWWRRRQSTSSARSTEIRLQPSDGAERKGSFPAGGESWLTRAPTNRECPIGDAQTQLYQGRVM